MIYLLMGALLMVLFRLLSKEKQELIVWIIVILFWPFILIVLFIMSLSDLLSEVKI